MRLKSLRLFNLCLFLLFASPIFGQEQIVDLSLESAENSLRILNTFPDSFPQISVVFKAEKKGQPVWDLKLPDLSIYENDLECEKISLEPISKRKPIKPTTLVHRKSKSASLSTILTWDQFGAVH